MVQLIFLAHFFFFFKVEHLPFSGPVFGYIKSHKNAPKKVWQASGLY